MDEVPIVAGTRGTTATRMPRSCGQFAEGCNRRPSRAYVGPFTAPTLDGFGHGPWGRQPGRARTPDSGRTGTYRDGPGLGR